jgi:hypothetical protein
MKQVRGAAGKPGGLVLGLNSGTRAKAGRSGTWGLSGRRKRRSSAQQRLAD